MKKILLSIGLISLFTMLLTGQHILNPSYKYYANPGIINITEITGATGIGHTSGKNEEFYYGITNIFGYQIDRNFLGGLGIGYLFFDKSQFIPLYLDFRYGVYLKEITPYISTDGGIMVDPTELISGTKMFLNPGIGISRYVRSKLEVYLSTGVIVQMGDLMPRASFYNFKLGVIFRKKSFRLYKPGKNIKYF
jgi:hypothetical protein